MITESFKNRLKELAGLNLELNSSQLTEILHGYIECALWTEEERLKEDMSGGLEDDDDEDEENTELDKLVAIANKMSQNNFDSFTKEHISPNSLIQAYTDIKSFIQMAGYNNIKNAIEENGLGRLGHDIWLTRNRHGAGFFDHSYDHEVEKTLTNAAQQLKEVYLYIDDNLELRFSNED